jgi:hypothetical protein
LPAARLQSQLDHPRQRSEIRCAGETAAQLQQVSPRNIDGLLGPERRRLHSLGSRHLKRLEGQLGDAGLLLLNDNA